MPDTPRDEFPTPALLDRYITGECSGETAERIRQWVAASPENGRQIERLKTIRDVAGQRPVWNVSGIWTQLTHDLAAAEPDGVFAVQHESVPLVGYPKPGIPEGDVHSDTPLTRQRQHHRPSGIFRLPRTWAAIAGTGLAMLMAWGIRDTLMIDRAENGPPRVSQAREYVTAPGQRASITLPDGSQVRLGADSRLRYTAGQARIVFVDGEAFFTIAHRTTTPFIVQAANTTTQVLGTAFSVRAYPGDTTVQVGVTEGRVAFRLSTSPPEHGQTLNKGDLAIMPPSGKPIVRHDVSSETLTAWVRGELRFTTAPLNIVIRELQRWYGLRITLDNPSLDHAWVTATFQANESQETVVTRLAGILGVRVQHTTTGVTLIP